MPMCWRRPTGSRTGPSFSPAIFASRFPSQGQTLWTFVNRNPVDVDGEQLSVSADPAVRYYDLWHGKELTPTTRGTGRPF